MGVIMKKAASGETSLVYYCEDTMFPLHNREACNRCCPKTVLRLELLYAIFDFHRSKFFYLEIAWNIITDILSEILESKDVMDELADIREKKRMATLEQRRSFFVRMVSDPAIQPGFTKTPNRQESKLGTQSAICEVGTTSRTERSWISWPLAYLMSRESNDTNDTSELSLRFRHLDTMVRLKTGVATRRVFSNGYHPEASPSISLSRERLPNEQKVIDAAMIFPLTIDSVTFKRNAPGYALVKAESSIKSRDCDIKLVK
ncbi:hypothetical protein PV328_007715 [Microctonus aethiopoides]|uniref:Uncharacterized protein n=1 Tax=Microctonus aethiopoides TaxID=144406 RepID=A0AA39C9S6_9HYME|nr:hypothetical protein PV328_007715 [Microctonus aethiopoides]